MTLISWELNQGGGGGGGGGTSAVKLPLILCKNNNEM